jgi:hypothetical protein
MWTLRRILAQADHQRIARLRSDGESRVTPVSRVIGRWIARLAVGDDERGFACTSSGTCDARRSAAPDADRFVHRREFVDPDGTRKHLKPRRRRRQRVEVAAVARHDAAPEADIDVTLPPRRLALRL